MIAEPSGNKSISSAARAWNARLYSTTDGQTVVTRRSEATVAQAVSEIIAFFRFKHYTAVQQIWTRNRLRVALPAADPPDNHKKTVHLHNDLAQGAGSVSENIVMISVDA